MKEGKMNLKLVDKINKNYDSIIVFLYENKRKSLEKYFSTEFFLIEKVLNKKNYKGKKGEKATVTLAVNDDLTEIIVIGLGEKEKSDNFELRRAVYAGLQSLKGKEFLIVADDIEANQALAETILISNYKFDKYKSKDKEKEEDLDKNFDLISNIDENTLLEASAINESVILTRNLVNEPANVIYPETLAAEAKVSGEKYGFQVEILNENEIEKLGMKAFLAVSRAAYYRPYLIVMRYMGGDTADEIIGLVGKGLTYDTGGLSLKPSSSMDTMKSDMGGAATVIGAISAVANLKLKKNVIAVIAACENSIGGNAYRPGDIINSMAGKTIEVINTDAEGRLTLVDAVHYIIANEKVSNVIDVATLTGAALIALGTTTTAALSNNDDFYKKIETAAKLSDERLWRLPNYPEYGKLIESKIADLKNTGGRYAGTITAGMFIEKFVANKPWIHLDIAGSSWTDNPYDYYTLGGTGQMVRTLYNFIKNY